MECSIMGEGQTICISEFPVFPIIFFAFSFLFCAVFLYFLLFDKDKRRQYSFYSLVGFIFFFLAAILSGLDYSTSPVSYGLGTLFFSFITNLLPFAIALILLSILLTAIYELLKLGHMQMDKKIKDFFGIR